MYVVNPVFDELDYEVLGSRGSLKGQTTHYILLYALVRCYRPKVAVEIGCFEGCSTAYIAQALKDNYEEGEGNIKGHLWTFDNLDFGQQLSKVRERWKKCGLSDWITFINGDSQVTVPHVFEEKGPCITFAFIDGCHEIEGVLPDTENIVRYSHPLDCVVCHHDINRPEDCTPVYRSMKGRGFKEMLEIPAWGNLGVARKGEELTKCYWGDRPKDF